MSDGSVLFVVITRVGTEVTPEAGYDTIGLSSIFQDPIEDEIGALIEENDNIINEKIVEDENNNEIEEDSEEDNEDDNENDNEDEDELNNGDVLNEVYLEAVIITDNSIDDLVAKGNTDI